MGWLDKYDDTIVAQGGKTIPLSREDYLRQQHQNYLKSQAEKGRKAVVEGREKFAKDYVIPAIKTAASFTPAGPLIGLADAYNAYQEGNTGWAIAGAGMEALPYAGKVVGKAAPIAKTVAKNLKKDNLKTLIYNNISPASYTGKKQEIKNLIRDIKYIDNPTIHSNPIRETIVSGPHSNDFYGLDPQVANRNRNDAWKLYLGIDDKGKSLYIPTNKKDVYRYNPSRISDEAEHNFLNQEFDQGYDFLTSNAGGVGHIKNIPSNLPDVQFAKMRDTWDLQPFKEANRSLLSDIPYSDKFIFNYDRINDTRQYKKWVPDKLKNLEIGEFLGVGKPFTVEHSIPYTSKIDFVSKAEKIGNEEYLNLKPTLIRNRVTDRIVYEKPDYDELIKDIYNKKFDETFQEGGTIPKAQEGKKVKKSVIFAESPKIEEGQPQYEIYDYHSQLPPSLNNLREKYKDLRKRSDELYSTTASHRNYLINYLKGYTGKDVYSVNSDNTYYARNDDGYGSTYSTEEFKDLPPLKKYNELQKELDENYYPSLMALEDEFRDHPDNTTGDRVSDVFQVEGNKLREWYKKKGEELSVIPIYGIQDTSKVNAALKDVDLQDVGIMGHSGEILGGIPLEWWNNKLKDAEYRNCILGSCYGDNLLPLLPDVKNIYHTIKNRWYGVNPSADSLENALFSTYEETKIKPTKGKDYNISNKYKTGGNVSYTPEYIEQLKQFENIPDNLAYHLDNKKIPTIGWGHKITEEELKRKAIKMGKEWVPYERFSGKEGRILADKLMEQDVSHHYNRLERQVGKDTLNTLPPEVQDVLLDITYNRGSLGDSLEYVKKGDIAGLRDYLAETSKGLKGGAKTRMEWRANKIPLKTLPPVETPIYYTDKDKYVPKALQSIAEVQPSPQALIPIQDNEGYRNQENYGKPVQITSNESRTPISMDQVPFPILAMSDTGELKIMMPGEEHTFEGGSVTELPMTKKGGKYQKGGEIDPVLNEVKDAYNFIKSYHYSPKFEERYRNMYANDLLYNTKHEDHFIDYYSNIIPTIQNPQFKKEYEDQLRYYQKERDESLKKLDEKVDLSVSTARNKLKDLSFFTLRGEERQPWSDRIIRSFKGRPNPEGVETGSHYNIANNIAFIYKDQLKDGYGNPGSIAAHEFSHAVSSHIPYSIDMILKQSKMLTDPRDEHDVAFDETKSDIDALRYLLNKNKIYDTRTQDFTKEHLQRAKKTIKDFSFDRLQRLYNDDDLIELMNIIAANDNDKKEPVTIAKKGIVVKSNQLRTFTKDSGWLSKYKEL